MCVGTLGTGTRGGQQGPVHTGEDPCCSTSTHFARTPFSPQPTSRCHTAPTTSPKNSRNSSSYFSA